MKQGRGIVVEVTARDQVTVMTPRESSCVFLSINLCMWDRKSPIPSKGLLSI